MTGGQQRMPSFLFGSPLKPNLMFIRTPTAELCCHCTLSFSYPLQPLRLETNFASFLKHLQLSPVDFSVSPSLSHHIGDATSACEKGCQWQRALQPLVEIQCAQVEQNENRGCCFGLTFRKQSVSSPLTLIGKGRV